VPFIHEHSWALEAGPGRALEFDWRLAFGNLACHLAGGTGILLLEHSDTTLNTEVRQ
jgi:hypothetical protein